MFKKLIELLSNFFSSLFGGKKDQPATPTPRPKPVEQDKLTDFAEDSSDVPADTVVSVKVTEVVIVVPGSGGSKSPFADEDKENAVEDKPEEPATNLPTEEPKPERPTEPTHPTDTPSKPADKPKPAPTPTQRFLWCLDNGHGKLQAGKRSPIFDDGKTQFLEYEFNRDVVERIMKQLDKKGVAYYDVVPDYLEVGSFLEERVDRANKKKSDLPKIYVSVHANAGPTTDGKWVPDSIKGIETWYAQNSKKGMKIAAVFQKHLIDKTGMKDRNLKSTAISSLYVLTKTTMPAILTENGFYNNKEEVEELMKDSVRQQIADAHVEAILEIEKNGIG